MVCFFIQRPIFASAIAAILVLAGAICFFLLPVSQFPEITPPQVVVSANYPGAERAGRRRHGDDAARAADQRRRGHDLHVLVELERRLFDDHRHLQRRLSARYRRGRRAEPRVAGGVVAAGDRQSGRRDDQEAEPELRSDRQSDLARPVGRSGHAVELRLSADRRSVEAAARRRRRPDLRRAALFDARLARSRQARQSRRDRGRRPERDRRAERPGRRRQDRPVAGAGRNPVRDAGQRRRGGSAIPRNSPTSSSAPIPASGAVVRLRDVARVELGALQYSSSGLFRQGPDGRPRHLPDAGLERARPAAAASRTRWTSSRSASRTGIAYAMHYDTTRFVSAAMHDVVVTLDRGARSRRLRRLRLPAELARDDHSDDRHSRCRWSPRWR